MNKDRSQQRPRGVTNHRPGSGRDGILYIVGTPIGNPDDLSQRARDVLLRVSIIAAEHPAVTQDLLRYHGITNRITSYGPGHLAEKVSVLAVRLREGHDVALVVDGGMPVIQDPGQLLVAAARSQGTSIVLVPGPSAVTAAVTLSGFSGDRFHFAGAAPATRRAQTRFLTTLCKSPDKAVFFCHPTNLRWVLNRLDDLAPSRLLTIVADLTTATEVVLQGTAGSISERLVAVSNNAEVTVVLEQRRKGK